MPRKSRIPSLRRHRTWSLGVVILNGKDHYLGKWPDGVPQAPPPVQTAYDRLIAEWLANNRTAPSPIPSSPEVEPAARPSGATVEEAEWLACADPVPMLNFLRGKASTGKLHLFAVAYCRRVWQGLEDDRSERPVSAR